MEPTIYNANNGRVTVDFSFDYITIWSSIVDQCEK